MRIHVEMTIEKGERPIMLCWQSVDGRICINYYQYDGKWSEQYHHLKQLGSQPTICLVTNERTIISEKGEAR